jgi:hypothetical protein
MEIGDQKATPATSIMVWSVAYPAYVGEDATEILVYALFAAPYSFGNAFH